jgi:hypothetical protein
LKFKFLQGKGEVVLVVILAFLARLILSLQQHALTWDSSVYLGMGKAIFSFGSHGLWEPIRPIVWPIVLGFLWKFKLDPVNMGIVLQILLQVFCVYLLYKITHKLFHKDLAIIACLLFSFSPLLLASGFTLHPATLAMFFCLLSIYLFLNEKFFAAGIIACLSFLATFYYGLFLAIILIFLVQFKKFEPYKLFIGGFCIPLAPYLILNLALYKDPFLPFFSASSVINNVVGCNFLSAVPWYQYIIWILFDNPLYIFLPVGLYFLFKKAEVNRLLIFSAFILPFAYLASMHCRDIRYMLFFLPFMAIIAALGVENTMQKIKTKSYKAIFLAVILLSTVAYPMYMMLAAKAPQENVDYYKYANVTNGTILTNNPKLAIYTDTKLELLYYPLYTSQKAAFYSDDVVKNKRSKVFIDTCYGDISCNPNDLKCPEATTNLISVVKANYKTEYYANYTICEYFVFTQ